MVMDQKLTKLGIAYFLIRCELWFPIWVLFLQYRGLSFNEVLVADIVYMSSILLTEFPLGSLGDRIGRRNTFILGSFIYSISLVVMVFISNFVLMLISWIIWAVGISLMSGADTTYIYEMIRYQGKGEKDVAFFGYYAAIQSFAWVFSHFIGGYLYAINQDIPILLNGIMGITASMIIFSLPDPREKVDLHLNFKVILKKTRESISNKKIRNPVIILALLYMYQYTVALVIQPFMVQLNVNPSHFGYFYVAFTGLGILGGILAGRMEKRFGMKRLVNVGIIMTVMAMGITAFIPGTFSLSGIIIQRLLYSIAETMLIIMINRELNDNNRSSVFSFVSLFRSLIMVGTRPFLGFMVNTYGGGTGFSIWLIAGIPMMIYLLLLSRNIQSSGYKERVSIIE